MRQWTWTSNSLKLLYYGQEELQIPPPPKKTKTIMVKMPFQMARLALLWERHRGQTVGRRKTEKHFSRKQDIQTCVKGEVRGPKKGIYMKERRGRIEKT